MILFASLGAVLFAAVSASARHGLPSPGPSQSGNRLTSDLNGTIAVHDGDHMRVKTDLGNISINTRNTNADVLAYRVHLETDAAKKTRRSC